MNDTAATETQTAEAKPAETPVEKTETTLDDLLNEFKDTPQESPKAEPPKVEALKPEEIDDLRKFRDEQRMDRVRKEVTQTVESIREAHKDVLGWMTNDWIEGRLDAEARKDPRIGKAFLERDRNPEAWAKVRQKLGERLAEEIKSRPNPQLTADRDAARAAVSGQTATQPSNDIDPKKFNSMTERELEEYVKARRKA